MADIAVLSKDILTIPAEEILETRVVYTIVGGTDDVMEWWFYLATPVAWGLIVIRVLQNVAQDIRRYRNREPFILQASLLD